MTAWPWPDLAAFVLLSGVVVAMLVGVIVVLVVEAAELRRERRRP